MRFISVCSGIEAASVALEPLGFEPTLYSEIEPFPRAVLEHRLGAFDIAKTPRRRVPIFGDFTALRVRHLRRFGIEPPQLLVGGTPCQAFSVAGIRRGLADDRGNLTLQFVRLAHALANAGHLRYLLWENVVGALGMPDNSFGCFLGGIVGADAPLCSPHKRGRWPSFGMVAGPRARAAWRVFDCQWFGLAQRRARVFVVAGFGDGADPAQILFERGGMLGPHQARQEPRKDIAPTLSARTSAGGGLGTDTELDGGVIVQATCAGAGVGGVGPDMGARRLTPLECSRLMGLPDDWTRIPWRGRPASACPDGPQYRSYGNSFPVPIIAWIGERMMRQHRRLCE